MAELGPGAFLISVPMPSISDQQRLVLSVVTGPPSWLKPGEILGFSTVLNAVSLADR